MTHITQSKITVDIIMRTTISIHIQMTINILIFNHKTRINLDMIDYVLEFAKHMELSNLYILQRKSIKYMH